MKFLQIGAIFPVHETINLILKKITFLYFIYFVCVLTFELGCGLSMLLHNVHFEGAMLCEACFAVGTLVRFLARVAEFVPLEMERVGESLPTNVARERSLPSV